MSWVHERPNILYRKTFQKKNYILSISIYKCVCFFLDGRLCDVLLKKKDLPNLSGLLYILLWIRYPHNKWWIFNDKSFYE